MSSDQSLKVSLRTKICFNTPDGGISVKSINPLQSMSRLCPCVCFNKGGGFGLAKCCRQCGQD